jgi:hypothetical protein
MTINKMCPKVCFIILFGMVHVFINIKLSRARESESGGREEINATTIIERYSEI